jgi:hypothetical protein
LTGTIFKSIITKEDAVERHKIQEKCQNKTGTEILCRVMYFKRNDP